MPRFSQTFRVRRPRAALFRLAAEPERLEAAARVRSVRREDAGAVSGPAPVAAGATWRLAGDFGPVGRALAVRLAAATPPERLVYVCEARGWRSELALDFAAISALETSVGMVWTLAPIGLRGRLAFPVAAALEPRLAQAFRRLARRAPGWLEAAQPAAGATSSRWGCRG